MEGKSAAEQSKISTKRNSTKSSGAANSANNSSNRKNNVADEYAYENERCNNDKIRNSKVAAVPIAASIDSPSRGVSKVIQSFSHV